MKPNRRPKSVQVCAWLTPAQALEWEAFCQLAGATSSKVLKTIMRKAAAIKSPDNERGRFERVAGRWYGKPVTERVRKSDGRPFGSTRAPKEPGKPGRKPKPKLEVVEGGAATQDEAKPRRGRRKKEEAKV